MRSMPTEKILGTNIRFYREARGMTQEELAHELCLRSRTTLSNWESGYSSPDAEFLPQIANALHVSIDYRKASSVLCKILRNGINSSQASIAAS